MSVTYIDAIREAQETLLREDPRVFLYGQDIANFGGAFKATKGLSDAFPGRVIDSPISEDAMIGLAVGAAIEGMRPIVEMQFADFSSIAFNQIVNQAATHYYRTGMPIPITVRLPSGGTPGSGPFHSQSMEGIYAQYPGLVVVTPATVSDAYHMLIDSVKLDDPVLYCEHKFLYRWLKSKAINGDHLPIGQARIARPGKHATVVTYSAMVHEAVRAADRLQADGWEIEVVDLDAKREEANQAKPIRKRLPVDELPGVGKICLFRAKLEAERRFCGNTTEALTCSGPSSGPGTFSVAYSTPLTRISKDPHFWYRRGNMSMLMDTCSA